MSIINATAADFNTLSVSMSRMEQNLGGEITARLLGFLRPPQVWENTREQLRICVSHSTATLRLDSLTSHLVRKLQSSTVTAEVHWRRFFQASCNASSYECAVGSVKKVSKSVLQELWSVYNSVELKSCSDIIIKILYV